MPDVQYLTIRMFSLASTAYHLLQGTKLYIPSEDADASFIDVGAIASISRDSIETYRKFFEVYVRPHKNKDDDEFEYEYCRWYISGLIFFKDYENIDLDREEVLAHNKEELQKIQDRIAATDKYKKLKDGEQKDILEGKSKFNRREFAIEAGFSPNLLGNLFKSYSGFAHADAVALQKLIHLKTREKQKEEAELHLVFQTILVSKYILEYAKRFPEVSHLLEENHYTYQKIQEFERIAKKIDNYYPVKN